MHLDLRSDTVTRPTPEMWTAIRSADLGDDVLGDDPTVIALEEHSAQLTGHQAALFVPSGTMGNQIALGVYCRPGDAAIFESDSHMVWYEGGAPAALSGVMTKTLPGTRGAMDPEAVRAAITKRTYHTPATTLLCLENTHNRSGGSVLDAATMGEYRRIADESGIPVHLDGARIFNAAVALGVPVSTLTRQVTSVNFCLSKGLGAPVGSVLCGPSDFIEEARYLRKRFGGGMRQSGMLAAAGIYALDHHIERLSEDHSCARRTGEALQGLPGICVDLDEIVTNFVMVHTERPAADWIPPLEAEGLRALPFGSHRIRLVFHLDIPADAPGRIAEAFQRAGVGLSSGSPA